MIGRTFNGRYRITERIGIGGMAEVYRAQDNVLGRVVAIKVMLPQYAEDAEFTQRFRQEAGAAANLQSPYIVNVYDWGQDEGTYYIVMEYVRGSDLKTAINERGAINERKVAQIGSQVCQALNVAHHMDIIHRDVKPQNIMVQPDGNVKVMDFGIARAKNSIKTQTSSVLGTAHYISPEQAQGKELTPASDIYSLGIVMYEAVTGKLPFDGPDAISVATKQVNEAPVPPHEIVPNINPGLENIILRALEKDPRNRFSTATEMRHVLNDFLAGRMGGYSNVSTQQMAGGIPPAFANAQTQAVGGGTSVIPTVEQSTGSQRKVSDSRDNGSMERKSGKKKAAIVLVILALIAAVGVAAFLFLNASNAVPDVSGKSLTDAKTAITNAGYSVGTTTEVFNDTVESGRVISTDPTAGTKAQKGDRVNITVSKGKEQVVVPDLSGLSAADAQKELSKVGLGASAGSPQYSASVAKDQVMSQNPVAGSKVDKGNTVAYVLSLGPETVDVPSVTGLSQSEASAALQKAGFSVTTSQEYSDTIAKGSVISQNPTAGTAAEKGASIALVISMGAEPKAAVPNITGLTVGAAKDRLASAGFNYDLAGDYSDSSTVTSYTPNGQQPLGETITITAQASSTKSTSTTTTKSQ